MKRFPYYILLVFLMIAAPSRGTHFLGAEVRYTPTGSAPYTYTIEVDVYSDLTSPADRPWILLNGVDTMPRVLILDEPTQTNCGSSRLSTYRIIRSFAGPGIYSLRFEDANRNSGIVNIPTSVQQGICVEALLVINPDLGENTSMVFDTLQTIARWEQNSLIHDPGARDEDGDSLSFELVAPKGTGCEPIAGYSMPADPNSAWVEEATGVFRWDAPVVIGQWNVTIRGREYRGGQLIGEVTRDMTVCVLPSDVGVNEEDVAPFALRSTVVNDQLWIDGEGRWSVMIIDAAGRSVMEVGTFWAGRSINVAGMASGPYHLRATDEQGRQRLLRFVKTQ